MLTLVQMDDNDLQLHWEHLLDYLIETDGTIESSPCWLTNPKDGRISIKGIKKFFGYQLAAWSKYGREYLEIVPPNKTKADHMTISHLCGGGPRCCNPDHITIEFKWLNDERTQCMAVFLRIKQQLGSPTFELVQSTCCPHNPKCFSADK